MCVCVCVCWGGGGGSQVCLWVSSTLLRSVNHDEGESGFVWPTSGVNRSRTYRMRYKCLLLSVLISGFLRHRLYVALCALPDVQVQLPASFSLFLTHTHTHTHTHTRTHARTHARTHTLWEFSLLVKQTNAREVFIYCHCSCNDLQWKSQWWWPHGVTWQETGAILTTRDSWTKVPELVVRMKFIKKKYCLACNSYGSVFVLRLIGPEV